MVSVGRKGRREGVVRQSRRCHEASFSARAEAKPERSAVVFGGCSQVAAFLRHRPCCRRLAEGRQQRGEAPAEILPYGLPRAGQPGASDPVLAAGYDRLPLLGEDGRVGHDGEAYDSSFRNCAPTKPLGRIHHAGGPGRRWRRI